MEQLVAWEPEATEAATQSHKWIHHIPDPRRRLKNCPSNHYSPAPVVQCLFMYGESKVEVSSETCEKRAVERKPYLNQLARSLESFPWSPGAAAFRPDP